jgi:hypothetical protein
MSETPSTVFQPSSLDKEGFDKMDKRPKNESLTPTTERKQRAVTPDEAAKMYAGPSSRPTSAKELYVAQSLAGDREYQRKVRGLSRNGNEAAVQALLAERTAHHAKYWDNVMHESQKADFANEQAGKGNLEKSEQVNTDRLEKFRRSQSGNYRPPGETDQDRANKALMYRNDEVDIQERREAAGLTAGNTPEEKAQNRAILQARADERNARGQGANPMIGRVTGATTYTGSGGDVTTTRYKPASPTADQATVVAASQSQNAAARDASRNDPEFQGSDLVPGKERSFVMSGEAFNAMQERGATKNNPAQRTNDQKVFVAYKPSPSGGVGQYQIQGGANNVPGYTTPNTVAGSQPGTINGMPGKEAIAQAKTDADASVAAFNANVDRYQKGGVRPESPVTAMLNSGQGTDEPNPLAARTSNTLASNADADRQDRQTPQLPLEEKKGKKRIASSYQGPTPVPEI